ncbi:uncharacterized protein LOC111809318 [Cucurbita pepo subsp. pepo]|uniref:uncharacterized protein LOC111809318 n=1 Tax=Cucurbita pepo subsp. pepo TaxID=3664 RepID=UPI000C9D8DD5|nr:uncharacterized protein LOC111809318 [Cucurbita pepo subsp. pepo]
MGNWMNKEPPPPMVLVPPLFDYPPLAARTRMLESSYNLLFGKLALKCLFEEYFDEARHFSTVIMLKPIDDPHVDLVATVSGPLDHKPEEIIGNALFRWQSGIDDPHTFMDLYVSNSDPVLQLRSCAYYPKYGIGAFGIFPVIRKKRLCSEDFGLMGLRYGSRNLSVGVTLMPFSSKDELPKSAWLVSKMGRLTTGVQFEPQLPRAPWVLKLTCKSELGAVTLRPQVEKEDERHSGGLLPNNHCSYVFYNNLFFEQDNIWLLKCYIFINAATEKLRTDFILQFIASFYQHVVVQRRVKNPLEENEIVGITNYIDFGFELQTRVDDVKPENNIPDSTFQIAASWQANKNFLLKGKVGPLSSSLAMAFKSWWKPSFTFSISAIRDRIVGKTAYGFGIRVENLREASYQRADPNFVMLTPSKEHLAEGLIWKIGKRPMLQSDINAGNFDGIPNELRPLDKIL